MPQGQRDFLYRVIELDVTSPFSARHFALDSEVISYMAPINGPDLFLSINEREGDRILFTPKSKFLGKVREIWVDLDVIADGVSTIQLYVASRAGQLIESNEIRVSSAEHTTSLATDQISVGLTSAIAVASASNRQSLLITNIGNFPCYLAKTAVLAANLTGFVLLAKQSIKLSNYTGDVYAAASTNETAISIMVEG